MVWVKLKIYYIDLIQAYFVDFKSLIKKLFPYFKMVDQ